MNVLMLGWEFPPHISGGLGVACEGLFKALAKEASVHLILPSSMSDDASPPLPDDSPLNRHITWINGCGEISNAPYLSCPAKPSKTSQQNPLYGQDLCHWTQRYALNAATLAPQFPFDLIHAHDWMTFQAGLEIKRRSGKPLVLHLHSLSYDRNGPNSSDPTFQIEQAAMKAADLVITVSQYTRDICIRHYGISASKIHHVHNGTHPLPASPIKKRTKTKYVLFLGRFTRQKGPHSFLKIAHRVLKEVPDTHFIMAGNGEHREDLEQHRKALKLTGKLTFPGFLSRSQIQGILAKTTAYCMPSVSEPFGLSALEASQYGIPCVISKQSGVAEILPDALVANHWDLEQMAHHLIKILKKPSTHESPSTWTLENQQAYSWESAAKKIITLYQTNLGIP